MRRFLVAVAAFPLLAAVGPIRDELRDSSPYEHFNNKRSIDSLYGDLTADQQVMQVLNRLTFGPRPGDVGEVRSMGIRAWLEQQLQPERINDAAIEQALARYDMLSQDQNALSKIYAAFLKERAVAQRTRKDTSLSMDEQEMWRDVINQRAALLREVTSARVARAVVSERQLLEVMTDFWLNHFNVFSQKNVVAPYYLAEYDQAIRAHALGKFRDLLGAVAHSPSMLLYLDNAQSRANPGQPTLRQVRGVRRKVQNQQNRGLNENYGRELLELHTLGVDGGYTQNDVIAVARALTGWSIQTPEQGGKFTFRAEWHDAGEKTVLGKKFPAGRGEDEGEAVLDLLARHPATARFIAMKLARRFVSDTPPAGLVERAAQRFTQTDGDIREVIKLIITSPEFFSQVAYRAKVKSPFEVVVSAARALDAPADPTPKTALAVAALGQPIYGHQAPNGWPETGEAWMNTGAILNRINFGMSVAANRLPGVSIAKLPWADSVQTGSREQQVDAIVARILGGDVSPDTRAVLMSGSNPLAADAGKQANGFAQILGLALGAPEFQRR